MGVIISMYLDMDDKFLCEGDQSAVKPTNGDTANGKSLPLGLRKFSDLLMSCL